MVDVTVASFEEMVKWALEFLRRDYTVMLTERIPGITDVYATLPDEGAA